MVFTAQAGNDTLEQAPKRTHELSCSVTRSTVKFYLKVVKVFILAMFWGEDFCGCSLLSKLCTNSKYLNGRLIWFWYVQVAASLFSVAYFLFYIFSSDSRWNIDFLTLQIITWCMTAAKTYQHLSGFELTVCDSRSIFIISRNTFSFFSWNSGINF